MGILITCKIIGLMGFRLGYTVSEYCIFFLLFMLQQIANCRITLLGLCFKFKNSSDAMCVRSTF